ncbi:unnamed protein product [Brachionus calyciflorus]|uniref:MULE transposase domain-containing protein n=1 Tax=Brachionus calyciflorus TaxID=104777 RepID=A0A814HW83_9BILA|nr:unnamed protein product [Brachionus calyciflorus]
MLQELQAKFDPGLVAEAFKSEETARITCSKNKSSISKKESSSTLDLVISEDQSHILINNQQQLFLRFDNFYKNGDRILIFMSETTIEIMQKSQEYHFDGTFKNAPKMFYQILTAHAVINNHTYPCAYIFLENKNTKTYVIVLEQLRNICFPKNLKKIMCDFESALMKSVNSVFPDVILKGCWFHYSQAIRKNLFSLGFKFNYLNDWKFKFWVKRFISIPLIPVENIIQAFNIIIEEIPLNDEKIINFIKYYQKQWLNGSISPEIWNHHDSQKRTNNDLEGYHSKLTKFLPKYHPKFSDMITCIKKEDVKTRNVYLSGKEKKQSKKISKKIFKFNLSKKTSEEITRI